MDDVSLLGLIFKSKPKAQQILIWTKFDKRSYYFTEVADAERKAQELKAKGDVYFGCCTASGDFSNRKNAARTRPTSTEVIGCGALYLDLDYGDSHQKKNIPQTEQDAISLVMRMPAEPSVIVSSGNGLHVYWLLDSFVSFTTDTKRQEIQKLNEDWQRKIQQLAEDYEQTVDSTFNLDRILRVDKTLNHKSKSPKEVVILDASEKRYSVKELRDYVGGVKQDSPTKRYRSATSINIDSNITLNENATYDAVKFHELCREEPRFKQSFERTRRGMKDTSPSAYDMSLATFTANAGWTDQEIVDLLISARRIHKDDLKLRDDYYARTLLRARTTTANEIKQEIIIESANAPVVKDKHENLKNVSNALGIEIQRFIKYSGDTPTYVILFNYGHQIKFTGAEVLQSSRMFNKLVMEQLDVQLNAMKTKDFANVVTLLLNSVDVIQTGTESSELGSMSNMLAHYLKDRYNEKDDNSNQLNRILEQQPARYKERVYFSLSEFMRYIYTKYGEKRSRSNVAVMLRRLESEERKISIRPKKDMELPPTSRLVWLVPDEILSLYHQFGGYEVSTDDVEDDVEADVEADVGYVITEFESGSRS